VGVTVCESGLRDVGLANSMPGATSTPFRQPPDHFVVAPQNSGITLFLVLFISEKYVKY
jgi:hypothetical protein